MEKQDEEQLPIGTGGSDSDISCQSSSDSESEYKTPKKLKRAAKKRVEKEKKKEKQKEKRRVEEKLSKEDFYNKNHEFRTWLLEEKKKLFDGLSADRAKELFKKFVKKWNSKKLPKKYYRGIDLYMKTVPDNTDNRWSFAEPSYTDESDVTESRETPEKQFEEDQPSTPSTPFSTFGKNTPSSTMSARKYGRPIFVAPPMLPLDVSTSDHKETTVNTMDAGVTKKSEFPFSISNFVDEESHVKTEVKEPGTDKTSMNRECNETGLQSRKRRYDQMSQVEFQRVAKTIHASQEVEKKKMKALLEMSRSTQSSRISWKENSVPTDDSGSGYFQV